MAEKTIRNNYGESVAVSDDNSSVYIRVYVDRDNNVGISLTPEQARELSLALSAFGTILTPQETV